jgi:ribosomal protein L39E
MVEIPSCKLELTLTKDSIIMQLGKLSMRNTYQLEKTDNPKEILILVARDNSDIPERMILKTNEKVIIRKGIFPQPEVKLIKVKKSN